MTAYCFGMVGPAVMLFEGSLPLFIAVGVRIGSFMRNAGFFAATAASVALTAFTAASEAAVYTAPGGPLIDASFDANNNEVVTGNAFFPLVISGQGGTVGSLNSVTLTGFTHPFIGDFSVVLVHPDLTTTVSLISPPEEFQDNANGTYTLVVDPALPTFSQAANDSVTDNDVPGGTYAPESYGGSTTVPGPRVDYNDFNGLPIDGTWRLLVADLLPVDTGELTSFSLDITPAPVPEPTSLAVLGLGGLALLRRKRA